MSTTAQTHQQDLERLKLLRYIDDDFMTVCLADNHEGAELILRIILGREDITIKTVRILYMSMGSIGAMMKSGS